LTQNPKTLKVNKNPKLTNPKTLNLENPKTLIPGISALHRYVPGFLQNPPKPGLASSAISAISAISGRIAEITEITEISWTYHL
jgi:hypothetical protein